MVPSDRPIGQEVCVGPKLKPWDLALREELELRRAARRKGAILGCTRYLEHEPGVRCLECARRHTEAVIAPWPGDR